MYVLRAREDQQSPRVAALSQLTPDHPIATRSGSESNLGAVLRQLLGSAIEQLRSSWAVLPRPRQLANAG